MGNVLCVVKCFASRCRFAKRATVLVLVLSGQMFAATPDYHGSIRPILRERCVGCHNPNRKAGELDLSSYAGILAGSVSGKVVERGLPEDSLLYLVVTHEEEPAMPPEGDRLEDDALTTLRTWIEFGMPENATSAKAAVSLRPKNTAMATEASDVLASSREVLPPAVDAADTERLVFQSERRNAITALASSQDLIAHSAQNQIVLFDTTGTFLDVLSFPEGDVFDLHFSSDGTHLFGAGGTHAASGKVVVWDIGARERVAEYGDEFDTVLAADSTPNGDILVFGGAERIIKIVDTKTGLLSHKLDKHTDWVFDIAINPDGLIFASADRAGNLFVWETSSGQHIHTLRGHSGAINEIDWLHNEDAFVTAGEDGRLLIWDAHTGQQITSWKASNSGLLGLAVSPDDSIHTISRSGERTSWDRSGNKLSSQDQGNENSMPTEVEVVGNDVAVGTWNGELHIVREETGIARLSTPNTRMTNDLASLRIAPRRSMEFRQFDAANLAQPIAVRPSATAVPKRSDHGNLSEVAVDYFRREASKLAEEAKLFAAIADELDSVRDRISAVEASYASPHHEEALRKLVENLQLQQQQAAKIGYQDIELLLQVALDRAKLKYQESSPNDHQVTTNDLLILEECEAIIARLTRAASERKRNDVSPWPVLAKQLAEEGQRVSLLKDPDR